MPRQTTFPRPGRFEIRSFPMFQLSNGKQAEILVCEANMVLRTGASYGTGAGRQIDVEVLEWVATGNSRLLKGPVEFRMTQGPRRKSWVRAGKKGDLPGQARFALRYQVTTPQGTVKDLDGVAVGPIRSFPPRGDVFRIDKALKLGDLEVTPVACACPDDLDFVISLPRSLA
ncbi:MAG TPA: hypothetical protein VF121_18605 [Thermoanaerobaculia bacterium]|nr:hypothetical protein [Thermoanaerobaculia bacterium]